MVVEVWGWVHVRAALQCEHGTCAGTTCAGGTYGHILQCSVRSMDDRRSPAAHLERVALVLGPQAVPRLEAAAGVGLGAILSLGGLVDVIPCSAANVSSDCRYTSGRMRSGKSMGYSIPRNNPPGPTASQSHIPPISAHSYHTATHRSAPPGPGRPPWPAGHRR